MINPANQQMMADRMQPVKKIELDASHASLASHPVEVTRLIMDAAEA